MDLFPRVFLLVFAQLAVGGMLALSIPPFHAIERGYYKSTAFVFLLMGAFALAGRVALLAGGSPASAAGVIELALFSLFLLAGCAYMATLWNEYVILRARLFSASWILGLCALVAAAQSLRAAPLLSLETLLFPLALLSGALVLGTVLAGMLLGHWYLIDRELSIEPFRTMLAFYTGSLVLQTAVLTLIGLLLGLAGSAGSRAALATLVRDHPALLLSRLAVSPGASVVLAWMIHRTLLIPQTMAATGLFYIAILSVMVGEFLGRYILFKTGIPF